MVQCFILIKTTTLHQSELSSVIVALSHGSKYDSSRELPGQHAHGKIFRGLKTEWIPTFGYRHFQEAEQSITDYVLGYYIARQGLIATTQDYLQ